MGWLGCGGNPAIKVNECDTDGCEVQVLKRVPRRVDSVAIAAVDTFNSAALLDFYT